ncbi:phage portal protein [Arvimicrobium flavum]|uniref:phage portal protein n=1 Tax=Arvimicrobium flavum TaxID=3393320 RepID=UPI00237AAA0C|nr:phage portal protein [Mesorhizobium shangrilense]
MVNWLDKSIAAIWPQRGLERIKARERMSAMSTARQVYEGATVSRRSQGWRVVSSDANAEIKGASQRLRDVARDMVRNNPLAARGKQSITVNTVGAGIIPTIALPANMEKQRLELERLLVEHFDTTSCDADGRHDLYGLESLAMGTIVESGEVLIRMRPRRPEDRLPLPFQLQVMEPDYLDSSVDGPQPNGNFAVQGVEFNLIGKRVAYHLFSVHPGAASAYSLPTSTRIPAELVAHVFRSDRPGQARGVPWFAPVVLRLRDFADYSDAQLIRQKIAACFGAFITTADTHNVETTDGQGTSDGKPGYSVESLEPGMIERLRPGDSVTFGEPPEVEGYGDYTKAVLREIAAGLGISYEAFTGDLSGVNFSSGRMGWLEFQRSIDAWRNHMLIPQMCAPVANWFLDGAAAVLGRRYPAHVMWTPPRREMIDPTKEIPAARNAIRSGLSSRAYEQRRLGFDPDVLDAEIAASNKRADDLGLILDSDPRKVSLAGTMQTTVELATD